MNPDQWQAVRELFLEALEREPAARALLLEAAGASHPEIAREAALLLAAEETGTARIDDVPAALGLEARAEAAPEHIGRYRVLGVLGDGRAGIVYRVRQENPEREVALKLLRSTMWSKGSLDRFRNEVHALSLLRHEHIARIYDAGTLPEPGGAARPYFVMELVEGMPISEFVRSNSPDERGILELFLQVCDAVEHAHMLGVIHRDLKPANVLVDSLRGAARAGDVAARPAVKVIDFGIARILHSQERATLTGQVLGTPGYMSPEQREGRIGAIDTRTDVFAAGAILGELLSLRDHSRAGKEGATAGLRPDLRLIVQTATAPDLAQRYQSVAAFAADLRRYLANRPIEARAPSVWYTFSKFVRRNRALSGAIAAAALVMAGMLMMQQRTQAQLHSVTRAMLNEVAENLVGRIGGSADRKRILGRLLPLIESFAMANPNDGAIQNDYAKVLGAMGDSLEDEAQYGEALSYVERALTVRERLAGRSPEDAGSAHALSIAVVRVGDLLARTGAPTLQHEYYLRALGIDEAASAKWPGSQEILNNLAFSYERVAALAMEKDLLDEAKDYSERQMTVAQKMMALDPESSQALWGMGSALGMKGAILARRRFDTEQVEVGREEIRILRRLCLLNPVTKQPAKRLANCLLSIATSQALVDVESRASSAEMASEAASIARELTLADPTEVDATLLRARALCVLASTLNAISDTQGAERAMTEARAAADGLAARCNGCQDGELARLIVENYDVRRSFEMHDTISAGRKARAALPMARRVAAMFPSIESKQIVCHLLLSLPVMSEAENEEAIEIARGLVRTNPKERVKHTLNLAEGLVRAGRSQEADEIFEELTRALRPTEAKLLKNLEIQRSGWKPDIRE